MPFTVLKLRPGVNLELTPSLNEAGYSASQLIRYRNGLAEKLGGWAKYFAFAVAGVPKALHAWLDLNENEYLGVGTTEVLAAIEDGQLSDITPQALTSDFASNNVDEGISTTSASANVTVTDPNITGATTFDSVEFLTPVSVGGLILSGVYPVDASLGPSAYRIVAASNATATVNFGGLVPEFDTTSGSSTVEVTLADHGLSVGSKINFPIPTTVGGITIQGTYTATVITSVDVFEIAADMQATSTTSAFMNSGDIRIVYRIAVGPQAAAAGYSVGGYSDGGYSTGVVPTAQTGTPITALDWTLDNWGEIFTACPQGGAIYTWQPGSGILNAQMVSGNEAPPYNTGIFIAAEIQIMVAYGSTQILDIGLDQDPLLVKWSDQGDFSYWVTGATNPSTGIASQAGSRRLSSGSKIVGGMATPQLNLLWTDVGLWTMSYLGGVNPFGFQPVGFGCGLIGKHAAVRQGANVYWMGADNFFVLGGGAPQVIPCTTWDAVFQDLNTDYAYKCWAWSNTPFNEIWYFYPRQSTSATEPDAYAKFNTLTGLWDTGVLDRSAGIDTSILAQPIAATPTGIIYEHEVSRNADGQPLVASFTTGFWQLSEGQDIMLADWLLPDMIWNEYPNTSGASVQVTFYSKMYPGDAVARTYGPYTLTSTTKFKNIRVRGRLLSMKLESSDLDSFWRLGALRARVAPDGRL